MLSLEDVILPNKCCNNQMILPVPQAVVDINPKPPRIFSVWMMINPIEDDTVVIEWNQAFSCNDRLLMIERKYYVETEVSSTHLRDLKEIWLWHLRTFSRRASRSSGRPSSAP